MTTILIIAVAVNVVLFLLTIYTEIKRAKTHRDKLLEIEDAKESHTAQMVRLSEQVRNANNKLEELQKEYDNYKKNVETNELMSIPNTQDLRDLRASYIELAKHYEHLKKRLEKPSRRYILRKLFKAFDVKSKEQLAEVLNIKEIKL